MPFLQAVVLRQSPLTLTQVQEIYDHENDN